MSRRSCPQCGYVIDEKNRLYCPECFRRVHESSTGYVYLILALVGAGLILGPFIIPDIYDWGLILLTCASPLIEVAVILLPLFNRLFFGTRYGPALVVAYVVALVSLAGFVHFLGIIFGGMRGC